MKKLLPLFFSFVMLLAGHAAAQNTGVLSGSVTEKAGNRTLPGAILRLDKHNRYTFSDKNGNFEFLDVPAGEYEIEASYLGYKMTYIHATVTAGGNTSVAIAMEEDAVSVGEVVVMGDMLRGQAKAFNQQRTNRNITNVISADQVGRFPDSNIGDALKRVPGITMQNDQG